MQKVDFLVIGAGIAGLSLAARLVAHGSTIVLEAEAAPGYHSSGRSVAFAHYGLGDDVIRALTAVSIPALAAERADDGAQAGMVHPSLHIARADEIAALDKIERIHRQFDADITRISAKEAQSLVPVLDIGASGVAAAVIDHSSLKLDADAMLQGHVRDLRASGGELICNAKVLKVSRDGSGWSVDTAQQSYRAKHIVNAAGAWADELARLAGVTPIGLEPRRRTVISFAAPPDIDVSPWPFTKTIGDGFYMLPEGRQRLLASAMDQTPTAPCDAAPEELDIAIAADRVMQATSLEIRRIEHSWAGLRSFAPDERPAIGRSKDAPGFFWFAGQGGFGLQTSPALAMIGQALACQLDWPEEITRYGLEPELFAPSRLGA